MEIKGIDRRKTNLSMMLFLIISLCLSSCRLSIQNHTAPDQSISAPGAYSRSIIVEGWERTYFVFVPDCYPVEGHLPLVLMFHGGGGNSKGVSRDTGWSEKAQQECFFVVYPDGLPEDREQPSSFSKNPQLWNDGSGRFNQDVDDIEFIRHLIAAIQGELEIDPGKIFAAGFSNGASMTFLAAIKLNDVFAAVAPVAGALWIDDYRLVEPVSMLYLTGTEDPLNPVDGGAPELLRGDSEPGGGKPKPPVQNHINSWVKALDCDLAPTTLADLDWLNGIGFSGCREGTEVHFYRLIGAGHHWPGGKVHLPEIYVGKKVDTLNAVDLIWSFFLEHPKP